MTGQRSLQGSNLIWERASRAFSLPSHQNRKLDLASNGLIKHPIVFSEHQKPFKLQAGRQLNVHVQCLIIQPGT